jgi:replicative DNA helicase Mcm
MERGVTVPEQDPYWVRHLRHHNKADLIRVRQYPVEKTIVVDVSKITDMQVYDNLISRPLGQIDEINDQAHKCNLWPVPQRMVIRFVNISHKTRIADIRGPKDEYKLRSVSCLVKRISDVQSKVTEGVFSCKNGHFQNVKQTNDRIEKPKSCTQCNSREFKHAPDRETKISQQYIYVQELLEDLQGGLQPTSLRCEVTEDLCNLVSTGDRVVLNGRYLTISKFKDGAILARKDSYFEVNSIEKPDEDFINPTVSQEEETKIRALAALPDIFERLTLSIAPSIMGMRMAKQAIVLQMFGGVSKVMKDKTKRRGFINILIITDPAMAKTALLQYVEKATPGAVYASAVTASKVGLVAPIVRDEYTGQMTIEPGPYMLARRVFCLDEANEMQKDDAKYLGECMENGECHITKAMNALVKTEAALLAACNPDKGSFDLSEDAKPISKQISIPEAILSRFDLKILMTDTQNEERDRQVAEFISNLYLEEGEKSLGDFIEPDTMRKYLTIAEKIDPFGTQESNKIIVDYYIAIRKEFSNSDNMKITKRQLRALHLLSQARARIRLSPKVEEQDAKDVVEVFDMCLRNMSTGPGGQVQITNEKGKRGNLPQLIIETITEISGGTNGTRKASQLSVVTALKNKGYEKSRVEDAIQNMMRTGVLMEPTRGLLKVV